MANNIDSSPTFPPSYPWPCERDGIDTSRVADRPDSLVTERTHTEWHDSRSGRCVPAPDYAK